MASPVRNICHDHSELTPESVHYGVDTKPVTGLHYTKDELLGLMPVKADSPREKTSSSVSVGKQPSVPIKEEMVEDVMRDQSQVTAQIEPGAGSMHNNLN